MGTKENQEMEPCQEMPLIDILYKNSYRVDSLSAQLLEGTLRNVKRKQTTLQGSSSSVNGSIKVVSGNSSSKKNEGKSIEYNIENHDYAIINLLSVLDLPEYTVKPENPIGKLIHFCGQISIRSFKEMATVLPIIMNNKDLFSIPKTDKNFKKALETMLDLLPMGIEVEVLLDDETAICGSLKEEYMLYTYPEISITYGTHLPAKWHIIGILDDGSPVKKIPQNQLRAGIDQYTESIKAMYASNSGYNIMPILIYRELTN